MFQHLPHCQTQVADMTTGSPKSSHSKNVHPRAADTLLTPNQKHYLGSATLSKPKLSWNEDASLMESTLFPFIFLNYNPSAGGQKQKNQLSEQSRFRTEILNLSDFEFFVLDLRPETENFRFPNLKHLRHSNHCKYNFKDSGQSLFAQYFFGTNFSKFRASRGSNFRVTCTSFREFAGLLDEL